MNNILLLQAMAPGLDKAEREAIWNHIGEPTAYHNFHEHDKPLELEGFTHVILGGSEVNISEGEQPWFCEARRIIWECDRQNIPFLGICFGMQFLAYTYGAEILRQYEEIGPVKVNLKVKHSFFGFLPKQIEANAAHFESVINLPKQFLNLGYSQDCPVQIISHKSKLLFGVQFHPELNQSYIKALQESTNYKYSGLCQEIVGPARSILSKFCCI
ncbi:type 1 glutamine amidotransferase [Stenomitos frigidus]|nr:gamma-glutamyl-gamma-aminobutyrate hydrolase family protein [Stenomitos frigidus]